MRKKTITIFITITIMVISFYYTSKITEFIKNKDPIMKEIVQYNSKLLNNNSIRLLNVNKSYQKMKKIGKFDKNLLVFDELINDKNNDYITSGNKKIDKVTIIIELKDTSYIEDILKILNTKNINATFFVTSDILEKSIDAVKLILNFGNDIELLSSNYSIYEINKYNSIIKLISNDRLSYCFLKNKNDELLKKCKESNMHALIPSIDVDNYLYDKVKNNLENGSIIKISNNVNVIKELSATINYINQKGKKIVLLKNFFE
jgi:hypothetical protein